MEWLLFNHACRAFDDRSTLPSQRMLHIRFHSAESDAFQVFAVKIRGSGADGNLKEEPRTVGIHSGDVPSLLVTPNVPLEVQMLAKTGDGIFLHVKGGYVMELGEYDVVTAADTLLLVESRPGMVAVVQANSLSVQYVPVTPSAITKEEFVRPLMGDGCLFTVDKISKSREGQLGGSLLIVRLDVAVGTGDVFLPDGMSVMLEPKRDDNEKAFREAYYNHGLSMCKLVSSLFERHGARARCITLLQRLRAALLTYVMGPSDGLSMSYAILASLEAKMLRGVDIVREEELSRLAVTMCDEASFIGSLGSCLVRREKTAEAIPLLKAAFQQFLTCGYNPGVEMGRIRAYLGAAMAAEGDVAKGCANIIAANKQYPGDLEILCLLSRAYCAKGDFKESVRRALFGLTLDPSSNSISGTNLVHIALHVPGFVAILEDLLPVSRASSPLYRLVFDVVFGAGLHEIAGDMLTALGSIAFDAEVVYLQAGLLEEAGRHWQAVLNTNANLSQQIIVPLGITPSTMNTNRVLAPLTSMDPTPLEMLPKIKQIEARLSVPRQSLRVTDEDGNVSAVSSQSPSQLKLRLVRRGQPFNAPPFTAFICGALLIVVRCLFVVGCLDRVVELCARLNGLVSPDLALEHTMAREDVLMHRVIIQAMQHIPRYDTMLPHGVRYPLYMIGDSHVIPAAWQTLTFHEKEWIVVPGLIPRLAISDLITFVGVRRLFDSMINVLQFKSTVIFSLGDIDCKGPMMESVNDGVAASLDDAARNVAGIVLDMVARLIKQKQCTVYLQYPPPIEPALEGMTMTLWRAFDEVLGPTFENPDVAFYPLRLHAALESGKCTVDPKWTVLNSHFSPSYITLLAAELETFS